MAARYDGISLLQNRACDKNLLMVLMMVSGGISADVFPTKATSTYQNLIEGLKYDEQGQNYTFLDDTGKRNVSIEKFYANSFSRPTAE